MTNGNNFGNMRPIAQIGDLVRCLGYGEKIFHIDAYTHEIAYDSENAFEDIYYDMTDVLTKDYLLGGQEDIYVICKADKADGYLAQYLRNPPNKFDEGDLSAEMPSELSRDILADISPYGEVNEMSKEFKPTPRELSSQEAQRRKQERAERSEKVNVLLDEMNDYKALITMFGDIEGEYQARIDEVKEELAELSNTK